MSNEQFFKPILEPGESARLITSHGIHNVECVANGSLPGYTKDFGALTAGVWSTDHEDANLELNAYEFAQYRMMVISDVSMRFNNLGSTRQWRTAKKDFYLGQYPMQTGEDYLKELYLAQSEFFVWEIDTPRFDFFSAIATDECVVKFTGWRFRIREVPGRARKTVWISGWPSGAAR